MALISELGRIEEPTKKEIGDILRAMKIGNIDSFDIDMGDDDGVEVFSTNYGYVLQGGEDSIERGDFSFEFFTAIENPEVRTVGVYEISDTAFLNDFRVFEKVIDEYFENKELSPKIGWKLNVGTDSSEMLYGIIKSHGDTTSLREFLTTIKKNKE